MRCHSAPRGEGGVCAPPEGSTGCWAVKTQAPGSWAGQSTHSQLPKPLSQRPILSQSASCQPRPRSCAQQDCTSLAPSILEGQGGYFRHTALAASPLAPGTPSMAQSPSCAVPDPSPKLLLAQCVQRQVPAPSPPPPLPGDSRLITLSPSAALDALQVNQYTLTLEATCPGETPANGQLFVQVHTVDGPPQCMARFASQVGELVQVPEDVAPLTPIYTVVLQRPASGLRVSMDAMGWPCTA
uniref:Uncharacterized protein n=1 Tax=Gopherus evgoodei TaxID=1825980 RepID=A0A8C4WGZ3_9SAUR